MAEHYVDPMEQFVTMLAEIGLQGECEVHEGDCNLLSDECSLVRRDPTEEHMMLSDLIVRAREIMQGSNQ